MSDWTAERENQLRDDWAAGLSGGTIAARLAVTRAMVMGKVRRMKLEARKDKVKTGRPPRAPVPVPMPLDLTPPTIWKRWLLELEASECKWPLGDGPFVFCALPTEGAFPYCACHARMAYQPGFGHCNKEAA